jgi:hypothetical protein
MKKKLLLLIALIFILAFSLQIISAQGSFMNRSYIKSLLSETTEMMKNVKGVMIEVNEMFKSSSNKTINGLPVAYELYVSIKSNIDGYFPETGKYLSGLYLDDTGIYDIANGAYFDETNYMPVEPIERYVIEGTKNGKFTLILMISEKVPYFGDFLSPAVEPLNSYETLGQRYVNNALLQMKEVNADVFVFELDSTQFPLMER